MGVKLSRARTDSRLDPGPLAMSTFVRYPARVMPPSLRRHHRTTLRSAGLPLALLVLLSSTPARADGGAWFWAEHREPLVGSPPTRPWLSLRLATDLRFTTAAEGLAQVFVRGGPLLEVAPWLFVAANAVAAASRKTGDRFGSDMRLELEPWLRFRFGPVVLLDRNRIESRWFDAEHQWRYRNLFRIQIEIAGSPWLAILWDEVIFRIDDFDLAQNRAQIGLGYQFDPARRLEAGYMLRSFLDGGGPKYDHTLLVVLFYDGSGIQPAP